MTHEELRKQDIRDIGALLRTREGARFFSRFFEVTRVFSISYVPGDAGATAFNEGARNVGLPFYADVLEADEDALTLLCTARRERDITEEAKQWEQKD